MKMSIHSRSAGYSIMELLVSIGVGVMIIAALALFFGRGVGINRQNYEQILITEDARLQSARLTDVLRNATVNGSGVWLKTAGDNSLTIYSAGDTAGTLNEVSYSLSGTNFSQTILKPDATQSSVVLSKNVRNTASSKPIFTYYAANGSTITPSAATSTNVKRIGITLLIDANVNQKPDAAEVKTVVLPRPVLNTLSTTSRLWATTIRYPSNPSTLGMAEVQTVNPNNGSVGEQAWPIALINDGRLATYGGHYVNINYQSTTNGTFLPGWYAWVGPILVGESGNQKYYVTDQVPVASFCLNQDLSVMLSSCAPRTVTSGTFSVQYQPIIMYSNLGNLDYVRALTFDYTGT